MARGISSPAAGGAVTGAAGGNAYVALADFDGDGRPDLVLAGPREFRIGLAARQGF